MKTEISPLPKLANLGAAILALALSFPSAVAAAAGSRPNFVFIIGDDISAEDIGVYGNPGVRTPNIDRLAASGMTFERAYVTAPSCSPSRSSILTARYPHNLESAAELHAPLDKSAVIFPKILRDAGYFTAQAGKIHFGVLGFELTAPAAAAFVVGGKAEPVEMQAGAGGQNQWIERLRSRPTDEPFFMWFASYDAHRPWDAESFAGIHRPDDVVVPPYLVDTPETRQDLASYYDEITRLDFFVGEVVRELERQGVLENTMIIFTADNGRPFPRSKTHLYDDGVRVPFIVSWRGKIAAGSRTQSLASLMDVGPTLLEMSGLPRPKTFQGVSLLPILRDPAARVRDYIFVEKNWHNLPAHKRLAFDGRYAYMRNAWPDLPLWGASDTFYSHAADDLKARHRAGLLTPLQENVFLKPRAPEELYDLATDRFQSNNLVGNPAAAAALERMRVLLDRWVTETGDSVPPVDQRTSADMIYETGAKIPLERGTPPGASTRALQINRPGPIRADDK